MNWIGLTDGKKKSLILDAFGVSPVVMTGGTHGISQFSPRVVKQSPSKLEDSLQKNKDSFVQNLNWIGLTDGKENCPIPSFVIASFRSWLSQDGFFDGIGQFSPRLLKYFPPNLEESLQKK